jgi:hypothetical protein
LNWDALAEADSTYKVYQSDQAFSTPSTQTFAANISAYTSGTSGPPNLAPTYTATGLDNTKRYYFKVTAVNKAGYESAPASIALSPSHTGPIWWVATDGNDNTGDGSIGGPLSSILKAMEKAASGDTVMLKPGTYNFNEMRYPIEVYDQSQQYPIQKTFEKLVIMSQKGAASTIIDAQKQGRHFMIAASESRITDITGGNIHGRITTEIDCATLHCIITIKYTVLKNW